MPTMASKTKRFGLPSAIVAMIASTIAFEGGYVNDKRDPGGETNKGVTKTVAVAHGYTGPMRKLPDEVAYSIYYRGYLVAPGYLPLVDIDAPVAAELFDTTVNMGPTRPSRFFQQSINALCGTQLTVDGRVGPATIAADRSCPQRRGAAALCVSMLDSLDAAQRAEYDRLVRVNAKLGVFHRGWIAHRIGNVDRAQCRAAVVS
jgi:lysozyme family protein